jgi:hypothetical protein
MEEDGVADICCLDNGEERGDEEEERGENKHDSDVGIL